MATNVINKKTGELTIDPGASGDSFIQFSINSAEIFRIGVDDDTSNEFKISHSDSLGSEDTFVVTASGVIRSQYQPAFAATTSGIGADVTGDGTVYTIIYVTEYFDQANNFDGTSTFTAPIAGKYRFCGSAMLSQAGTATGAYIEIDASNRSFRSYICSPSSITPHQCTPFITSLVDMDASDTAVIKIMASGTTKTVDVGYQQRGIFSGALIC